MDAQRDDRLERARRVLEGYFETEQVGGQADLLALCEGDRELHDHVQSLLRSHTPLLETAFPAWPSTADAPSLGTEFGEFVLIEQIGRGGAGTVFCAKEKGLDRKIAVKILDRPVLADDAGWLRFRREADIAAALEHPNIVPLYRIGEADGSAFLAMKLLSGPSLAELAAPLDAERIAGIGVAIARALDAAHKHGVVHRDVTPANILLDGDRPYLVDFGLARGFVDATLTRSGSMPGTLPYMPPEQLREGVSELDPRIDVYGLGATLYELVRGQPAFHERDPSRLIHSIVTLDPPPLRLHGRDRDLETILLRALRKEPAARFDNAAEMADDLQRYLDDQPIRSRRFSVWERCWRSCRRHPRATALGTIAALALLALGIVMHTERTRQEQRVERAVQAATTALEEQDHVRAAAELEALGEPSGDPRADRLMQRARTELALDDVIFALADCTVPVPARRVAQLRESLALGVLTGGDRADVELALVLAALTIHGGARARSQLETEYGGPRDNRAYQVVDHLLRRCAASTGDISLRPMVAAPPPGETNETRFLLTAIAMRLCGAPQHVIKRELEQGYRPKSSTRFWYLRAANGISDKRPSSTSRPLSTLLELPRQGHPRVLRALVRVGLTLGHLSDHEEWLPNAVASLDEDRSGVAEYLRLEYGFRAAARSGKRLEYAATVDRALDAHGDLPDVVRFAGEYRGHVLGQISDGLSLLESVLADSETGFLDRELALTAAIVLAAQRHPPFGGGLDSGEVWQGRLRELTIPLLRGIAMWRLARALPSEDKERLLAEARRNYGGCELGLCVFPNWSRTWLWARLREEGATPSPQAKARWKRREGRARRRPRSKRK